MLSKYTFRADFLINNFYSSPLDTGSIDDNFVLENRLLSRKKTFIRGIKLTSDSFCIKELSKIQNYSSIGKSALIVL